MSLTEKGLILQNGILTTPDGKAGNRDISHQPLDMNFDSETMPEWFGLPDPKDKAGHFKIDYVRVWQQ